MDISAITTLLKTRRIGNPLEWHERLDSTNAAVQRRAAEGAREGLVIGADFQTMGRGRFHRAWRSEPAENVLFSVLLRPPFPVGQFPLINFLAATAVAETLERYPGVQAALRWPNDVYINDKKVCGVLSETCDGGAGLAVGIGVNVNQKKFPRELARATSIAVASGMPVERGRVLHILLNVLDDFYDEALHEGFTPIMRRWRARCDMFGKHIVLRNGGTKVEGTAATVGEDGALRVQSANGAVTIYAGDATVIREEGALGPV